MNWIRTMYSEITLLKLLSHLPGANELVPVIARCCQATSHYLNQCWLIINEVLWHSLQSNFIQNAPVKYQALKYVWQLYIWNYSGISQGSMSSNSYSRLVCPRNQTFAAEWKCWWVWSSWWHFHRWCSSRNRHPSCRIPSQMTLPLHGRWTAQVVSGKQQTFRLVLFEYNTVKRLKELGCGKTFICQKSFRLCRINWWLSARLQYLHC